MGLSLYSENLSGSDKLTIKKNDAVHLKQHRFFYYLLLAKIFQLLTVPSL